MKKMTRMTVPFFDLQRQSFALYEKIVDPVNRVLCSGKYVSGEVVERFEKKFAGYVGSNYCVAVNSGTTALLYSLMTLKTMKGYRNVYSPINTYLAISEVVSFAKMDIKYYDVNSQLLTDPEICKSFTQPGILVPVHLYGQAVDMQRIKKLWSLPIIEDACQAHGVRIEGRHVGTFGDMGCFSFYPSKNLGCYGEGGAIVTDNSYYSEYIRNLRNHKHGGGNGRMSELQAAILTVKLRYLDLLNEAREKIAEEYYDNICCPYIKFVQDFTQPNNFHLFVIRVEQREKFMEHMSNKGIECRIHYDYLLSRSGVQKAFKAVFEIVSLPLFPEMLKEEIEYVIEGVNSYVY